LFSVDSLDQTINLAQIVSLFFSSLSTQGSFKVCVVSGPAPPSTSLEVFMSTPAAFQEGSAEQCTGGIRSTTWHHGSPSVALVTTDESNAIHFGRSREGQVTLGPARDLQVVMWSLIFS